MCFLDCKGKEWLGLAVKCKFGSSCCGTKPEHKGQP